VSSCSGTQCAVSNSTAKPKLGGGPIIVTQLVSARLHFFGRFSPHGTITIVKSTNSTQFKSCCRTLAQASNSIKKILFIFVYPAKNSRVIPNSNQDGLKSEVFGIV